MTTDPAEKWKARYIELFAEELERSGQKTLAFHVRAGIDNSHGGTAAVAAAERALAEAAADGRGAQQELDAQLCDIAAAGHDEAFAAADHDPALTETQREAIKDRIAARSRTASGLATAIRAQQKP